MDSLTYWEKLNLKTAETISKIEASSVTLIDARIKAGIATTCEFAGNKLSPGGQRGCKHYDKSEYRDCCMYFKDDGTGMCDCRKE